MYKMYVPSGNKIAMTHIITSKRFNHRGKQEGHRQNLGVYCPPGQPNKFHGAK